MTALSLTLPDPMVKASTAAAKRLGLSRTQFIRQAITHELQQIQARQEIEAMAHCLVAMNKDRAYLKAVAEMDHDFDVELPDEGKSRW